MNWRSLVLLGLGGISALAAELAPGIPSRDPQLDVLPGFQAPPPGYGEVPFWWWTGDRLDPERLVAQLKELHRKGVSGVQVNYSHYDSAGWLTDQDEPKIFSDAWWQVYGQVSKAAAEMEMGIGLSTYTLDWPRGARNLFHELFYAKPELNALELQPGPRQRWRGGEARTLELPADLVAVRAYPLVAGKLQRGGLDLAPFVKEGRLAWTAPAGTGDWEVWSFQAVRKPGSMNPLKAGIGDTVVQGFFQPFQDHNPGRSAKGLNYFFNDELDIGVGKFAWNPDFPQEFARRKGYELFEALPAMWDDLGAITPKVRMDYADVRMALMEERYFKPIYSWHAERNLVFACDMAGRGTEPHEFGDYFRAVRWYSAPGHDTPGGRADLIKGKVSSSIANLYQRPRVWLEGYHSLGWGAMPEQLMFATRENYLYGCTLLNLHGLYYTTYGSHWEWAPPCYHFRMPYWAHMGTFLRYFERLSYLMSQGHTVADVAIVYPVAPYEAEMDGDRARNAAFDLARRLMAAGISFEFVDNDSLARATVDNGRLVVKEAGASYQALVLPEMTAVRWPTIAKAAAFAQAGGRVYAVGSLPAASDRAGRDDPELAKLNDLVFKPDGRLHDPAQAAEVLRTAFVQDVRGLGQTVRALHRKVGPRDVYLVMDARPDSVVEFRARGAAELLDPWTGKSQPLRVVAETATGTQVELPLEAYEAQIVLFSPGQKHLQPPPRDTRPERARSIPGPWTVAFVPTMDNAYGDFRMPATPENKLIGVEARRFAWARETPEIAPEARRPGFDDRNWERKLHGFGTQFYVLGPIPPEVDAARLDAQLAVLKSVDPKIPVSIEGKTFAWRPYDFSWQEGKEGDPGHQGYHGLKRGVTDDFLCLGKAVGGLNETRYEPDGGRYYLWTSATVKIAVPEMDIRASGGRTFGHTSPALVPAAVYLNGAPVALTEQVPGTELTAKVSLQAGANPILVRYDKGGRGHFVLRTDPAREYAPWRYRGPWMTWLFDGAMPFDVSAGNPPAEWFRFVTAPGTTALRFQAQGTVDAWIDGEPMPANGGRFVAATPHPAAAVVALRIKPTTGFTGGGLIPEPIVIETDGKGTMPLGDWSKLGILNNYSGGVRYASRLALSAEEAKGKTIIDLGKVAGTAEVQVNGQSAGIRVAPPWMLEVTGLLKAGDNTIEVLVYNSLANHYQTLPSRYRGNPTSGLFGPVRLLSRDWPKGEEAPAGQILSEENGLGIVARTGPLAELDSRIQAPGNLARRPGWLKPAAGTKAHAGGGQGFNALFNGTAGNRNGTAETANDGATFVGLEEGNTLELTVDPALAPHGIPLQAIRTYAGHADGRASQAYTVYAATAAAPAQFAKLADVAYDAQDGLGEITIAAPAGKPLLEGVRTLRFVFHDGPLGFNVYREIAIFDQP